MPHGWYIPEDEPLPPQVSQALRQALVPEFPLGPRRPQPGRPGRLSAQQRQRVANILALALRASRAAPAQIATLQAAWGRTIDRALADISGMSPDEAAMYLDELSETFPILTAARAAYGPPGPPQPGRPANTEAVLWELRWARRAGAYGITEAGRQLGWARESLAAAKAAVDPLLPADDPAAARSLAGAAYILQQLAPHIPAASDVLRYAEAAAAEHTRARAASLVPLLEPYSHWGDPPPEWERRQALWPGGPETPPPWAIAVAGVLATELTIGAAGLAAEDLFALIRMRRKPPLITARPRAPHGVPQVYAFELEHGADAALRSALRRVTDAVHRAPTARMARRIALARRLQRERHIIELAKTMRPDQARQYHRRFLRARAAARRTVERWYAEAGPGEWPWRSGSAADALLQARYGPASDAARMGLQELPDLPW